MNGIPESPMCADALIASLSIGTEKKRRNKPIGSIPKICLNCGEVFMVSPCNAEKIKCCSQACGTAIRRVQSFMVVQGIKKKRCSDCREYLDLSLFSKCKTNCHGLSHLCIRCTSIRFKNWAVANKDALSMKRKANRTVLTARMIKWQKAKIGLP